MTSVECLVQHLAIVVVVVVVELFFSSHFFIVDTLPASFTSGSMADRLAFDDTCLLDTINANRWFERSLSLS